MKKAIIVVLSVILMVAIATGAVAANYQYNFTSVPPLGKEVDLVANLSNELVEKASKAYYKDSMSDYEQLKTISANCKAYIGEDILGGCYFTDASTDPHLYVLLKDMSMKPDIKNDRVVFTKVKYSMSDLKTFQESLIKRYTGGAYFECSIDVVSNKVDVGFTYHVDIDELYSIVPEDAIEVYYLAEDEVP